MVHMGFKICVSDWREGGEVHQCHHGHQRDDKENVGHPGMTIVHSMKTERLKDERYNRLKKKNIFSLIL